MALSLSRPKHRPLPTSPLIHLFSSSSTPPPDPSPSENPNISQPQSPQQSSLTSYFSDVKASLKQKQHHQQQIPGRENRFDSPPPHPPRKPTPSKVSLDEIRKNLSEFRLLSSAPDPIGPNSTSKSRQQEQLHKPISFQELYKRNVVAKSGDGGVGDPELSPNVGNLNKPVSGKLSFETIRESLRQMRSNSPMNTGKRTGDAMSLAALRTSLKQSGNEPVRSTVIGGTELPKGLFGKEIRKDAGSEKEKERMSTEFLKMYKYEELGEKLRNLRPEVRIEEKGWFSLQELNERLRKLREVEEKEAELSLRGFNDIRESLWKMKVADEEQYKKNSMSRLNILAQIGATPAGPPKEHLVEKYLHPDNMSSADKMKIELAKVRDEFKMSESDCGSARVQVAQLTTKIKHLSSALHKKDKHSRKGLQGMVQKRKKLLKYLRRTDWDSYCFVISKLGLRDNPDYKN